MHHLTHLRIAGVIFAISFWTTGLAQGAEPQPGRLLASNCFQCHGTNGNPVGGFDRLAGKSANKICDEMLEWKSGKEGTGIMALHARGYSDEQLRQIATFFSKQPAIGRRRD